MVKPEVQHIIAIGASAGGMEEIHHFFDNTPTDQVSYVIVQHLSPDFKNRMIELLAKHSKLKVKEAENKMLVERNQVYFIPSKKFMAINNGRLYLTDKKNMPAPHFTVNTFFKSLAQERGNKAIAVVLSGLGSDGSEGIKAIKAGGGMVIVRDPLTSQFPGMPNNAIATGVVSHILEPELMPALIQGYVKEELNLDDIDDSDNDKNIITIVNLIKDQLPFDFSGYKPSTILRRIKRRAAFNNFYALHNYIDFIKDSPEEIEALAKDFLISVTSFFRDKEAFKLLQTEIIPDIIKNNMPGKEVKIWVAGCATGEEAYSMAILLSEELEQQNKDIRFRIFATDIDLPALASAGNGIYEESLMKDVPPGLTEKYFVKTDSGYKIKPEIRKMLIFVQHDLVKNPPYCNMDLISCRNLLIYMTPVLQKKIFLMLLFGLKKSGYLFLGSSETPMPIIQNLEIINEKWKIYKSIEPKRIVNFDSFPLPDINESKVVAEPVFSNGYITNKGYILADSINDTLMTELGFALICIDEKNNVLKAFGDTTKYLLQKNFNSDLAELLPEPLFIAFQSAKRKVLETKEKVNVRGVRISDNQHSFITVDILIKPLPVKKAETRLFIVLFGEDNFNIAREGELFEKDLFLDEYTRNLIEEQKDSKAELNSTLEKLDASNENMQSFNEELISANEEMQSTNEEMQSVNEELHTINADYELKNKELAEINDDLNNYFRSNICGQLIVDEEVSLVKFSPNVVKHINLLPSDVGRPLKDVTTNIKFETIVEDIKKVVFNGDVITREVQGNTGKWYQVVTMPYIRQADNKTNGAILSFNDITELKRIQLELDSSNKSLRRINEDLDNFVHIASHDLLAPLANIQLSISVMNEVKVAEPELKKFFDIINSSVKKLSSTIKEMAFIGKIQSEILEVEQVDLAEIINDITFSLKGQIDNSGAVITTNLKIKDVVFSKKNLRSMMYNLISNAIKYKSDNLPPVILISSEKKEGYVLLSVKDNGIGIPPSGINKVFEMYSRLSQNVDGQGVGLFLTKKIVDAAEGNIIVESKPGQGSTFTIFIKSGDGAAKKVSKNN